MELSTDYLPLLICISLIVITASLIYMYFKKNTKEVKDNVKDNDSNKKYQIKQNVVVQEQEEENYSPEDENMNELNMPRIKSKIISEDEDITEKNFNAPLTSNGNVRHSIGDDEVLNSRVSNSNSLSFIDKLQKRFDTSS